MEALRRKNAEKEERRKALHEQSMDGNSSFGMQEVERELELERAAAVQYRQHLQDEEEWTPGKCAEHRGGKGRRQHHDDGKGHYGHDNRGGKGWRSRDSGRDNRSRDPETPEEKK